MPTWPALAALGWACGNTGCEWGGGWPTALQGTWALATESPDQSTANQPWITPCFQVPDWQGDFGFPMQVPGQSDPCVFSGRGQESSIPAPVSSWSPTSGGPLSQSSLGQHDARAGDTTPSRRRQKPPNVAQYTTFMSFAGTNLVSVVH